MRGPNKEAQQITPVITRIRVQRGSVPANQKTADQTPDLSSDESRNEGGFISTATTYFFIFCYFCLTYHVLWNAVALIVANNAEERRANM